MQVELLEELVDLGASVHATNPQQLTSLHYAASAGQVRIGWRGGQRGRPTAMSRLAHVPTHGSSGPHRGATGPTPPRAGSCTANNVRRTGLGK